MQFQLPCLRFENMWLPFKLFMGVWDGFFQTQTSFRVFKCSPKPHFVGKTCVAHRIRERDSLIVMRVQTHSAFSWRRLTGLMDASFDGGRFKSWGHRAPAVATPYLFLDRVPTPGNLSHLKDGVVAKSATTIWTLLIFVMEHRCYRHWSDLLGNLLWCVKIPGRILHIKPWPCIPFTWKLCI